MKKANGKSETEMAGLDLEHELPPADGDENPSEVGSQRAYRRKHPVPRQNCRS